MLLFRWIFRPAVLIVVSGLLVCAAAVVFLRPGTEAVPPQRMPLRAGDREVAFVYPATSGTSWDRFVAAVRRASARLQQSHPGMKVQESAGAEGSGTSTPEVTLEWPGAKGRLVFRWYKLTSDWTPQAWMKELLRPPYPLAVVGGSNSHWARELALSLREAAAGLPERSRPLLLVTTATADRVSAAPGDNGDSPADVPLTSLYPERTYRFCFSNRQMATAVTRFIWTQPDLRPDADPVYLVQWMDDSYSKDLIDGTIRVLDFRAMDDYCQEWAFVAGGIGLGLHPAALAGWYSSGLSQEGGGFPLRILTSVGSFSSPNPYEAESSRHLLTDLRKLDEADALRQLKVAPHSYKRLLVVTGQAQPSRRFLRDLARSSPENARKLVVATGDAISFNYVYRDRLVTWAIQDLPFKLVFFCHRNPIDPEAGFRPLDPQGLPNVGRPASHSETDDLLLYADIVEAVVLALPAEGRDAAGLALGLDGLHLADGRLTTQKRGRALFNPATKTRNGGTGEHVVCLRPHFEGSRVLPEATIEVWCRGTDGGEDRASWRRVGEPLPVSYVERKAHGDRGHGGQ